MTLISAVAGMFAFAFILGLSGALMPGPTTFATIDQATRRGVKAGPLVTLGHSIPEALITIGLVFGLGQVLTLPGVTGTIGIVGSLVLIWLGYGMIRDARSGRLSLEHQSSTTTAINPFTAGIITTISNPYWFLWWGTVGAYYVLQTWKQGVVLLAAFYLGHITADLIWMTVIALAAATGRRFLSNRFYNGLVMVLGLFLIGMAGYFLYSGIKFLC
jgi:threonine/homoserine/homoserine lactone efflux protein